MELDLQALLEDVVVARVELYKKHCEHADNPRAARIVLAAALLLQAVKILAVIHGDRLSDAKLLAYQMLSKIKAGHLES